MSDFLSMGGYGAFIWPAYGVTVIGLGGAVWWVIAEWRRAKAKLAALAPRGAAAPEV